MAGRHVKAQCTAALIVLMFASAIAQADQPQRFIPLGQFSNYRFTEEHQYGAAVQLWKEGTSIFGLFSYSEGLAGDTPTGMLEKVSYEPVTGRISFSAKLTLGLHFCKDHNNLPSRDFFSFSGILKGSSISGTLRHADSLHPDQAPTEEIIVLKKIDEASLGQYRSQEQWEAAMKDILKFRGPKW